MNARKIENISKNEVVINLKDGNSIVLHPNGVAENVEVTDISGVKKFLKVTEDLGEIKPTSGRVFLRD